jgi:DNA-binding SARP family transcriptional activator
MARFYAHCGDHAAALRLLEAITTLEPTHREAWETTLETARAAGDSARAEAAAQQLQRSLRATRRSSSHPRDRGGLTSGRCPSGPFSGVSWASGGSNP